VERRIAAAANLANHQPQQVRGVNVQGFLFRTDLRAVVGRVSRLYFDEMSQLLVAAITVFFSLLVLYAVRLCDPSFRVGWWLGLILLAPLFVWAILALLWLIIEKILSHQNEGGVSSWATIARHSRHPPDGYWTQRIAQRIHKSEHELRISGDVRVVRGEPERLASQIDTLKTVCLAP